MSWWILLLPLFALYGWLTWRQFFWGILILAATLPSYLIRFSVFGLPTTVLEGMLAILTIVWLWQLVRGKINSDGHFFVDRKRWLWLLGAGLFLLAATISAIISPHSRAAWGLWKAYFVEPVILFLIIFTTLKSKEEIIKILWALILGCIPITLFALIQKPTGWFIPNPYWRAAATRRVTGLFDYPNALALYLAPLLPLLWPLIKDVWNKKRGQIYAGLLALLGMAMILSLVFARSTGALLAVAAATVIMGLWHKRSRYLTLIAIVLGGLLIFFTPLKQTFNQEVLFQGVSGQIRLNMWAETIEMLKEKPFLGAGLAGYQDAVRPFHILKWVEVYLYPHNIILNFWTEIGSLGLLGFIILVFSFFILPAKTTLAKTLITALLIILIHGLVDVPYFKNDLAAFFWLLLGLRIMEAKFSTLQTR